MDDVGVAYSSSCAPCPPGTHSSDEGASKYDDKLYICRSPNTDVFVISDAMFAQRIRTLLQRDRASASRAIRPLITLVRSLQKKNPFYVFNSIFILAAGSVNCTRRKPCTKQDYFSTHTPCDEKGQVENIARLLPLSHADALCFKDSYDVQVGRAARLSF